MALLQEKERKKEMSELLKDIQTYWDMRAGGFSDASMEERKTAPGQRWENIFRTSLKEGSKVLDDGCGAGFFTTLLASMDFEVTAVDYSSKMLEQVRNNLAAEKLNADLLQMDVQKLDFPDNSFDAVVSRNVFWNLEHADQAYEEVGRVLKKDGILILEDGNYYRHYFNEKYAKMYQEFQKMHGNEEDQGCHARHNKENVDFHIMEEIAKKLPMSHVDRPSWDFNKLVELGFHKIQVEVSGSPLPMSFCIVAQKG